MFNIKERMRTRSFSEQCPLFKAGMLSLSLNVLLSAYRKRASKGMRACRKPEAVSGSDRLYRSAE